jgi:hypothetical protein
VSLQWEVCLVAIDVNVVIAVPRSAGSLLAQRELGVPGAKSAKDSRGLCSMGSPPQVQCRRE